MVDAAYMIFMAITLIKIVVMFEATMKGKDEE